MVEYLNSNFNSGAKVIYMLGEWHRDRAEDLRNNNVDSCAHAIVQVGNQYFDSKGLLDVQYYKEVYRHHIQMRTETVEASLEHHHLWNPSFNRDLHLATVASIFGISLSHLLEEVEEIEETEVSTFATEHPFELSLMKSILAA